MEKEGSLPHSQVLATCPYTEKDRSSPYHLSHFMKIHLNIIFPLWLGLQSGFFPSGFSTKTVYTPLLSPVRATCQSHIILLNVITFKILGEQYISLHSSLWSFLPSPFTSSLLDPNIPLHTLISKHSHPTFLPHCERPSFTPTQNNRQNYISV